MLPFLSPSSRTLSNVLLAFGSLTFSLATDARISRADGIDAQVINTMLDSLNDAIYAQREDATAFLEKHPIETIPLIEQRMSIVPSNVDGKLPEPEASLRMLRLLSSWAKHPDQSPGSEAFKALERLARGTSTVTAIRAQNLLTDITLEHSVEVTKHLQQQGIFIGHDSVQVVTTENRNRYLLRLDDQYRGSMNELKSLRWLVDIDMVHARGKIIDSEVLSYITSMPNLRVLQIRDTTLTVADIELLSNLRDLEILELLYTKIEPEALELIAELPISHSLRLFGTGFSPEELNALNEKLDGIDFVHGRGGFLGIMSDGVDSNVVRNVVPGSGAALADLRSGDRINSVNGVKVERFEEIRAELAKFAAGEAIEIELERPTFHMKDSGQQEIIWQTIEAKVTLGAQE